MKHKNKIGIYLIKNLVNNKVYVGKSKDIYERICSHVTSLNANNLKRENSHFINAWNKYGRENFTYEVLELFDEIDDALISERELWWMFYHNSVNDDFGYNKRMDSSTGLIVRESTRKKLGIASKRKWENYSQQQKDAYAKRTSDFWRDNPDKKREMAKKVALKKRKYNVAKCEYGTQNIIKIYRVKSEVLEDHPEFYYPAINSCCYGNKNSYRGFFWYFTDLISNEIINKRKK